MLHVAHVIDTLRMGGAERLIVTFAEGIQTHDDIQMTVIVLKDHQTPFREAIEALGIELITFPGRSLLDRKRFGTLYRFFKSRQFDLIHTHLSYSNTLIPVIGRLLGIPVVTTLHNTKIGGDHVEPIRTTLEILGLRFGTRHYMAVGQAVKEAQKRVLPEKRITVIPNSVSEPPEFSAEQIRQIRTSITGDEKKPFLLAVGRFAPQKGFHDLVEAFVMVHDTHPDAILMIAGSGELHEEITQKIADAHAQEYIKLPGNRDDVLLLMAACDIFVNSSHWEGLPITILEAMASQTAIIATAVGEVPMVMSDGTGILIPPKQPAVIAQEIQQLLDDPEKRTRLGENAHAQVTANFGVDQWIQRIRHVYSKTMA